MRMVAFTTIPMVGRSYQSVLGDAAVDVELDTRDVGAVVRREEDRSLPEILGTAKAAEGDRGDDAGLSLLRNQAAQAMGQGMPGLSTLMRIPRSLVSRIQPRTRFRSAALVEA
jgi:hypothetical protein